MPHWKERNPLESSRHLAGLGLRLASTTAPRAVRVERNWRLPVLVALLGTIPAFYLDLLREAPSLLPDLSYLAAAVALFAALWHTARCPRIRVRIGARTGSTCY